MHSWAIPRRYQTCLRVVESLASQDLIRSSHPDCKVQFIFPTSCILQSAFAWPLPAALILALVTLTQANSADLIQRSFRAAGPKPWASGSGKLERPISLLNTDYKTLPNLQQTSAGTRGALRIHQSAFVLFGCIVLVRLQSVSRTAVQTDNAFTSSGRTKLHEHYTMQSLSALAYQICKEKALVLPPRTCWRAARGKRRREKEINQQKQTVFLFRL